MDVGEPDEQRSEQDHDQGLVGFLELVFMESL